MNEENVRDNRLVLFHEEIMEQERIELSELPDNIQKKIKGGLLPSTTNRIFSSSSAIKMFLLA